jgi:hypothetical protein
LIGEKNVVKVLNTVESWDVYDPQTVHTFLYNTPLFENMIGGILYEGIFEFIKRVDVLGNIVNKLPIIGPIRMAIAAELKSSLDRTIGVQIKTFLSSYNKIAVQRMAEFVLSPSNQVALRKVNINIVDSLVSKPISSLLPLDDAHANNAQLKKAVWSALMHTPMSEVEPVVDVIYDKIGTIPFGNILTGSVSEVLNSSATANTVFSRNIMRFLVSTTSGEPETPPPKVEIDVIITD